jgi:ketosteroid isomerase-like protein
MSQENVEIVRTAYELFNRYHRAKAGGDPAEVEAAWKAAKDSLAPDLEYREDPNWPGARTYRGLDAECRSVWDEYYEEFGEQIFEPERFVDSGDQVVVILRYAARGTSSGAAVEMQQGHLHTLRDGKIVKWEIYFNPGAALGAAGLRE